MIRLKLRYLAHVSMVTGVLQEVCETQATSLKALLDELDQRYGGFQDLFLSSKGSGFNLNAMIFYQPPGKIPAPAMNLQSPLEDGATLTFW
jgi:molybdopterin converting factor small subunit